MHQNCRIICRTLLGIIGRPPPHLSHRALDVGGRDVNGTLAAEIEEFGWKRTVLDQQEAPGVDVVQSINDPCPSELMKRFGLVISANVLEHLEQPDHAVNSMRSYLAEGGWIVLVTPNNIHMHREPIDCWRVFPDGMTYMLRNYVDARVGVGQHTNEGICDTWGIARTKKWTQQDPLPSNYPPLT